MSKKKWTVGDRAAFFVTEVDKDHVHMHRAFHQRYQLVHVAGNTMRIGISPGDLSEDFVGVIAAECLFEKEGWLSVWKVIRNEEEMDSWG